MTILGSGTANPSAIRAPSATWIKSENSSILIDCGAGTSQRLAKAGGELFDLDAILLTHAHIDHMADLPAILFAFHVAGTERERPLLLVHSSSTRKYLDGLESTFGHWLEPGAVELRSVQVTAGDRLAVGNLSSDLTNDLTIQAFDVDHHETSVGFIVKAGAGETVALPSDTGPCQTVEEAVKGVDCLVIECSATDEHRMPGHMAPQDVLRLLDRSKPGMAIVTHLYPEAERAGVTAVIGRKAACPVLEAYDGMTVNIRGET